MRNRIILVVAVVLIAAALIIGTTVACSSADRIAQGNTATPTKTPKPTFTITPTPTDTPPPTDTPTPTNTATNTPVATFTPIVYTATPTPTETPPPTNTPTRVPPTATRRPTSRPRPTATKAPPTNTPRPQFQWSGQVIWEAGIAANCGGVGVSKSSTIKDRAGNPLNGIYVLLDCYGNRFISHASGNPGEYDPGHYDFWGLSIHPVDYTCTLQICDASGTPVANTQVVTVQFDTGPCEPGQSGHQVATVHWTKNY